MRHKFRLVSFCLAALLLSTVISPAAKAQEPPYFTGKELDLLFLHDTHSHLESFVTVQDGRSIEMGGFPQIKTLIDKAKSENPDTLVVDAGDFSMGTLVQTVFASQSAELRMLGSLGVKHQIFPLVQHHLPVTLFPYLLNFSGFICIIKKQSRTNLPTAFMTHITTPIPM